MGLTTLMGPHSKMLAVGIPALSSLMYCSELRAPEIEPGHEDLPNDTPVTLSFSCPLAGPRLEDESVILENEERMYVTEHATVASSADGGSVFLNEVFAVDIDAVPSMLAEEYSGVPTAQAGEPIPEPDTIILLAFGALAALKRKRKTL